MNYQERVDMVLDWSKDKPYFDVTFFESIDERLSYGKALTPRQVDCIEKTIKAFDIKPKVKENV